MANSNEGHGAATLIEALGGSYYDGAGVITARTLADRVREAVTGGGTARVLTTLRGREVHITQSGRTRVLFPVV